MKTDERHAAIGPDTMLDNSGEELYWTARHGRAEAVRALLSSGGCAPDWRHPLDGRTPLGAAAACDHADTVRAS